MKDHLENFKNQKERKDNVKTILKIFVTLLFTILFSLNVKNVKAQLSCQDTVNSAINEIKSKGISKVNFSVINNVGREINNQQGTDLLVIGMEQKNDREYNRITNILSSPILMKNWVTRISKSCRGTGYVNFGLWQSDLDVRFTIRRDGTIFIYHCQESQYGFINPDSPPEWSNLDHVYCAWVPF